MTVFATIEFVFDANTTHTHKGQKLQEVNGKVSLVSISFVTNDTQQRTRLAVY